MRIIKGKVIPYTGLDYPHGFAKHYQGNYVTSQACTVVREGGVTKCRLPTWDMNGLFGKNSRFYFWSAIAGSTGAGGPSGSSVYITYRGIPFSSTSGVYSANRLRTGGSSVSGTSGTAGTVISSPLVSPFWQLEVAYVKCNTTMDMEVNYSMLIE